MTPQHGWITETKVDRVGFHYDAHLHIFTLHPTLEISGKVPV